MDKENESNEAPKKPGRKGKSIEGVDTKNHAFLDPEYQQLDKHAIIQETIDREKKLVTEKLKEFSAEGTMASKKSLLMKIGKKIPDTQVEVPKIFLFF